MRFLRPLSAGLAALLAAGGLAQPSAAQSTAGLGTSLTSAEILHAALGADGSLLDLGLLSDEGQATIDSAFAAPGATSKLRLGRVASSLVPGDLLNKVLPSFEASSSGQTSTPIAGAPLDLAAPLLSGQLAGGGLQALLANGVASTSVDAQLANLADALGGLLDLDLANTTLASRASGVASDATRTVAVGDLSVLDLGALLEGIGLDPGSLSLDQLAGLLDRLGAQLPFDLPDGAANLSEAVDAINALIDAAQAVIAQADQGLIDPVLAAVNTAITGILGSIPGLPVTQVTGALDLQAAKDNALAIVNGLLDELQELATQGLGALADLSLLRIEGLELGVTTKAVETVAGSTAGVVGKIGAIVVGNTTLAENIDLAAATDLLAGAVGQVNDLLGTVLGAIHPDLAELVEVSFLDKVTSVVEKDGYATATAGVTGLTARITPPQALATIVGAVNSLTSSLTDEVADVLGAAAGQVPSLSPVMDALSSALGVGALGALSQPATIRVAQVLSASNFRIGGSATGAPAAPGQSGSPTLPRTGTDTLLLTVGLAVVVGLIGRRILLTPQPKRARVDD
ncbi:MAG TPA: hypothetical protein VFV35_01415 [Acidimicrobiales bacterium]|nr:hypothetical protein [Acidimicrobiales bacterium]